MFEDLAHDALLNANQMNLLAQALTTGLQWTATTRFTNGLHFIHGQVEVVDAGHARSLPASPPTANPIKSVRSTSFDSSTSVLHLFLEPFILERERITIATLHRALLVSMPRSQLHIAGSLEDFSSPRHAQRGNNTSYPEAELYLRPTFAPAVNSPLPPPASPSLE